jgi:hypothetical protein
MENGQVIGNWASGNGHLECGLVSLQQVDRPLLFTHLSHGFVSTGNNFGIFGTKYEESKIIQGYTNLRR